MKVLGIVCSARKKGNTEILTRAALVGAEEYGATTELIRIADMQITQCDGCSTCHPSGVCKVDDDMQLLYPKLLTADGILLGSPVYFWSVSGHAKAFMDRTYALRYPYHKLKNKVCGALVAAGRRGSVNALAVINQFFLGHDMLVVGLGISGFGTDMGDVRQDKKAMRGAHSLGRQVVELLQTLKNKSP